MSRKTFSFQAAMTMTRDSVIGRMKALVGQTGPVVADADIQSFELGFLQSEKLTAVNRDLAMLESQNATLAAQFEALSHVERYLHAVRSEVDERVELRKKIKENKQNLAIDVVCEFLNLSAVPTDLGDLKKLVKDQLRNAFMVTAGVPQELLDAVDAASDLKAMIADPKKLLLFVAKNITTMYDVVEGVGNSVKVKFKPLIPESVAEQLTLYVEKFEEDCEKKQDALTGPMLEKLEVMSKKGTITEAEVAEARSYNEILNQRLDTLQKTALQYGENSDKDWKSYEDLLKRCNALHLFKRVSIVGKVSTNTKEIFSFFGLSVAVQKLEEFKQWSDLDREIRLNPAINMAMRTNRILKEHYFGDPAEEAQFLCDLETQRRSASHVLQKICSQFKFVFSASEGAENATLSASRHLVNRRKEACFKRLIEATLSDLLMVSGTGDAEFGQFFSSVLGKATDRSDIQKTVLDRIELLKKLADSSHSELKLNRDIAEGITKILAQYEAVFGADVAAPAQVEKDSVVLKVENELIGSLENGSTENKKLVADEIIKRLLSYSVPREEVEGLRDALIRYYIGADSSEQKRIQRDMYRADRICSPKLHHEFIESVSPDSDFYQIVSNLNSFYSASAKKIGALYRGLVEGVLKEKTNSAFTVESEQLWRGLSHLAGCGDDVSVPHAVGDRIHQREEFQARFSAHLERLSFLATFIGERKHLDPELKMDPRAVHLAAYTPSELFAVASGVDVLATGLDKDVLGFLDLDRARMVFDVEATRTEIAMSMLQRLQMTKSGKPADLVSLLDASVEPSKMYTLTPNDMASYHAYIKKYGDEKTKAALSELGDAPSLAVEQAAQFRTAIDDYLAQRKADGWIDRYHAAKVLAQNFSSVKDMPKVSNDIDTAKIARNLQRIAELEAEIRSTDVGLLNAIFQSLTFRPDPEKIVAEKKAAIARLKSENNQIEAACNRFCKEVNTVFSPTKIAARGSEFTRHITATREMLEGEKVIIRGEYKKRENELEKVKTIVNNNLTRYKNVKESAEKGGFFAKRFSKMRLFFMENGPFADGDQSARQAKVDEVDLKIAENNTTRDAALASCDQKIGEADQTLKSLVTYVVRGVNQDIVNQVDGLDRKQLQSTLASVRGFVAEHDPSQSDALNERLNFSWEFLNALINSELPDIKNMGKLVTVASPDVANSVARIIALLEGRSLYDNTDTAILQLKADFDSIKSSEPFESTQTTFDDVLAAIKEKFIVENLHVLSKEIKEKGAVGQTVFDRVESIQKLLAFCSKAECASFASSQSKDIPQKTAQFVRLNRELDRVDLLTRHKTGYEIDGIKEALQAQKKSFIELIIKITQSTQDQILDSADELADFILSSDREASFKGVFQGEMLRVSKALAKELRSSDAGALGEKASEFLKVDQQLKWLSDDYKAHNEKELRKNQAALMGSLSLLPAFRAAENYADLYENAFSFAKAHFERMLSPAARSYTREDFLRDDAFFQHADYANPKGIFSSFSETFDAVLNRTLSEKKLTEWNFDFACLVNKYAEISAIDQYRLHGLERLVLSGRKGVSADMQENAFAQILFAMDYGDVSLENIDDRERAKELVDYYKEKLTPAEESLIASLVQDDKPTWAHEIIVRSLGTEAQLQDMHAGWIIGELNNLHEPNQEYHSTESLLRRLFDRLLVDDKNPDRQITKSDLIKLVGEKHIVVIETLLQDVIQNLGERYAIRKIDISEKSDINETAVSTDRIDDRIRMFGGVVGDKLLQAFSMPNVSETIASWKAQRDMNTFSKEFLHQAKFLDVLSPRFSPKSVMVELLKPATQRAAEKQQKIEAIRREKEATIAYVKADETSDDLFEMVEFPGADADKKVGIKSGKYEYNFPTDPTPFFRNYLFPVQEVCITQMPMRILEAFSETEGLDLISPEAIQRRFGEFESEWIMPLISLGDINVLNPVFEIVEKKQGQLKFPSLDLKSLADVKALFVAMSQGERMEGVPVSRQWLEVNKGKPGIAELGLYLTAIENAYTLRKLLGASKVFLEIERALVDVLHNKMKIETVDFARLIEPYQEQFKGSLKALSGRMKHFLHELAERYEADFKSIGSIDQAKLDKLFVLVMTFGSEGQKLLLNRMQKVARCLNQSPDLIAKDIVEKNIFAGLDESEKALFIAGFIAKVKNVRVETTFIADMDHYVKIAAALKDKDIDAHMTDTITTIAIRLLPSVMEEANRKGDGWSSYALKKFLATPGVLDRIDTSAVMAEVFKIAESSSINDDLKGLVLSSSVQLIEKRIKQLLDREGAAEFSRLKSEGIEDYVISGTRGVPVKLTKERGEKDAIEMMDERLKSLLKLFNQYASPDLKKVFFEKAAIFLNTPHTDAFRKKQADAVRFALTVEQKTVIDVKRFFGADGRLNHKEVVNYSREFSAAMVEYNKLSSKVRDSFGLDTMIEVAKREAHVHLDRALGSFHESPDFFGRDADTPEDRARRKENESVVPASYALVNIFGESELYDEKLENVIYPNYLRYVVYREGDHASTETQPKYFRYGLFEALHKISGIPDPNSLKMLSEHRKDPPAHAARQQFFVSHSDLGKQFILHCQNEWRKMSLLDLLALENAGITFKIEWVAFAKVEAEKMIALWNNSHPDVPLSADRKNQIERECYLMKLSAEVARMSDGPEKDQLKKQMVCEKEALCIRENLVADVVKSMHTSVERAFQYGPVQRAITRDDDGKIHRLRRLDDKDLKNKIDGSFLGMRENPNLFKYEEIYNLFFMLKKMGEKLTKSGGSYSDIDLAFEELKIALKNIDVKIKQHGESGGEFDRLIKQAYDQVVVAEAKWHSRLEVGVKQDETASSKLVGGRSFTA